MNAPSPSRPMSSVARTALTVAVSVAFIASVALVAGTQTRASAGGDAIAGRGGPHPSTATSAAADVNPELQEQAEVAQQRVEAYRAARAAGTAGQARPLGAAATAPASGWAGEQPVDTAADDWEPAIAADPHGPYVYTLVTRYGTDKPCSGNCPSPYLALQISAD